MASERADPQPAQNEAPLTQLLRAAERGDRTAIDRLFAQVYDELQALAHRVRAGGAGETLNTTALVHEAYMKLVPSADLAWESRAHFFSVAARAMRQVLISTARRRMARKRGGAENWAVTFEDADHAAPVRPVELVAMDEALTELQQIDPRRAAVVEHRFFAGLTADQTARVLGVSTATVERDWRAARAWLTHRVLEAG